MGKKTKKKKARLRKNHGITANRDIETGIDVKEARRKRQQRGRKEKSGLEAGKRCCQFGDEA